MIFWEQDKPPVSIFVARWRCNALVTTVASIRDIGSLLDRACDDAIAWAHNVDHALNNGMALDATALDAAHDARAFQRLRHAMPLTMPALSSVTALDAAHDARAFQRLSATTFAILPTPRRTATPTVRLQ